MDRNVVQISKTIRENPKYSFFVFRVYGEEHKDSIAKEVMESFPEISFMLVQNTNDKIYIDISAQKNLEWLFHVHDTVKEYLSAGYTDLTNGYLRFEATAEYPEKLADQVQMLGQDFLYKNNFRKNPVEEDIIDPCDYGLDPW